MMLHAWESSKGEESEKLLVNLCFVKNIEGRSYVI